MRRLVVAALFSLVLGGCTVVLQGANPTVATSPSVPAGLTASGPMRCEANQELSLVNAYIAGDGPAVVVSGNCVLTVENTTLDVTGVAIQVEDNGQLTLRNSRVSGTGGSYAISGNGSVHASGTIFVGRRSATENGEFADEGGNGFND